MRWISLLLQSRFWQSSVWPGVFCGLIFYLLAPLPPFRSLERATLDFGFRLRGPRDADSRIVVLAVTDGDVDRSRAESGYGYPLPRYLYAETIKKLHEAGAKTIAFDVLFVEPSPALHDAQLTTATSEANSVVHAGLFRFQDNPRFEAPVTSPYYPLPDRFALTNRGGGARRAALAGGPFPALSEASIGLGHVMVFPEESGILRRIPHIVNYRNRLYPSLALAAVAAFEGVPQSQVVAEKNLVRIGSRTFPLDNNGDAPINWIGSNDSYPIFPLAQLLKDEIPQKALEGRLVLIGVTAEGAFESRSTPFSTSQPALEFQANAIDNLLSGRPLIPIHPVLVALATILFPTLCALLMSGRVAGGGLWICTFTIAVGVVALQLLSRDFYLPIGIPLLAGAFSTGITAATGYRREWDANARADAAVTALARGTTLLGATLSSPASGVTSKERLQSVIRVTARETLNAQEVFLVILDREQGFQNPLQEVAGRAAMQGHTLLWPPNAFDSGPRANVFQRLRWLRPANQAQDAQLFESAASWVQSESEPGNLPRSPGAAHESRRSRRRKATSTLIVAPLPRSANPDASEHERLPHQGALVAVGRRDSGLFTPREAVLLEALARQAAIALDNWEYGEALRGRVELANRELRDAYRLLHEQSAKLFSAVESIDAAIVVSDQEGRAAFVNAAGGRTLRGATPILGESIATALAAGDLEELSVQFESLRLQGASAEKTRMETMRGRHILSAQFTPLIEETGQVLGAMLVVSDITAQRELDRMKTDFVGFVAHELRTPLTTILGYASLLDQSAGRLKPEQMHDMTAVITRHCRRMNRLINDLLDISRLEAGQPLPLQQTFFDLSALLQRLVEEQRSQLNPFPPLRIEMELPPSPVEVMGDPDRIEQVVINLLTNAVKYSPDGGEIKLTLARSPEFVCMEVKDEGMGMTNEQVSNLFQKFYRTPDARSRGIKGTGLGLHLVKQIIESHDGKIEVNSSPGRGTSMRITLPAGVRLR